MATTLAIFFCLVAFAEAITLSSSMRRTYEQVAIRDPTCDGTGLRSHLGQNQEVFSCKPRFNKFTQQMEYPKCRVECASIAPEDPAVSKRYICKKNKGTWVERSHRTSINCSRPLVSNTFDSYFLFQDRRRNFEQRPYDSAAQTNVASIFPASAKATRIMYHPPSSSYRLYVLLDNSSLVFYDYASNEFDMTGVTLPTTGGAVAQMFGGRSTNQMMYVYSVGPTIFLKRIDLDTLVTSAVFSFTDPDDADIVTVNFEDHRLISFMYTTALGSRISAYHDSTVNHYGYLPAHNGCKIVIASFMSTALTTCGELSFPNRRTDFAAGTNNASRAISYTVNTYGRPLSEWNALVHVAVSPV